MEYREYPDQEGGVAGETVLENSWTLAEVPVAKLMALPEGVAYPGCSLYDDEEADALTVKAKFIDTGLALSENALAHSALPARDGGDAEGSSA
jgi:hypothetical protein